MIILSNNSISIFQLRRHPNPREADLLELQKLALNKGFSLDIQSNKELALSLEKATDKNDPTINQVSFSYFRLTCFLILDTIKIFNYTIQTYMCV